MQGVVVSLACVTYEVRVAMARLLLRRRVLVVALFLLVACSSSSSCYRGASAAAVETTTTTTTVDGPDVITAIYNFGDSITDTGNLVREGATGLLRYVGKLPYGVDFDLLHGPTGRCSNGYLMIDFLAKYLGLPLLNPYLDKAADFTHGVNFAVAGATALDMATLAERGLTVSITNSSLDVQLQWFKDFMAAATNSSEDEIRRKLASSLVMLEIGGNDFNYAFLQQQTGGGYGLGNVTRIVETLQHAGALVPPVVQSISNVANELLEMGAVRVVIAGNFPIGCVPVYLAGANVTEPAAYDADGCVAVLNAFAELYNAALRGAVAALQRAHPRAVVSYADYFAAYARVLREARSGARGFDPATTRTACCGVGGDAAPYGFDAGRICGAPGTAVCADRGRYVSWDGVHPTQHAYGEMAELLYRGGLAYPPPIKWPAGQTTPGSTNVPVN